MSNTKKTTETEEIIDVETMDEVKTAPKKANKPKHDPGELITCRSVCFGGLRLIGPKTKMPYEWMNQGDYGEVEYQDLLAWKTLHAPCLFDPLFIIEDEDICNEWNAELGKIYEDLNRVDLDEMFKLPHRSFVAQLKKLPKGMKSTIQNMAYSKIQSKELYDLRTIEAIDEILGTELKIMI